MTTTTKDQTSEEIPSPDTSPLPKPALTNLTPENTLSVEDWKHRPPYQTRHREDFGPIKWKGKCQCGKITYNLSRHRPLNAKYCHCRGCQIMHGAPLQWAAIFHKSDIYFTKGASGLTFYNSAHRSREYETPTKVSCCFCRSPIMDEGRRMCLIFPESIDFEDSEQGMSVWRAAFEASCHIFYAERAIEILDGKPKWAGIDEGSELLDDLGRADAKN